MLPSYGIHSLPFCTDKKNKLCPRKQIMEPPQVRTIMSRHDVWKKTIDADWRIFRIIMKNILNEQQIPAWIHYQSWTKQLVFRLQPKSSLIKACRNIILLFKHGGKLKNCRHKVFSKACQDLNKILMIIKLMTHSSCLDSLGEGILNTLKQQLFPF